VRITAEQLVGVATDIDGTLLELAGTGAGRAGDRTGVLRRRLASTDVRTVVDGVAALVDDLLWARPDLEERMVGIGVTVGGHVDWRNGSVVHSPNLHWREVPLASQLQAAIGYQVQIENDVNALAVAEQAFGDRMGMESTDVRDFAVVTVDRDGVGAGFVLNDEPYRGVNGLVGEFGHTPLQADGAICRCGKRGCLETQAGADVIVNHIRDAGRNIDGLDAAARLTRQGDAVARTAFEHAGVAFGRGLATLLNLLNLGLVIIHTEAAVHDERTPYRSAATRSLHEHAFSTAADSCRIIWRVRTDELEGRGAASMGLQL
jgi:predicted NBD/HSP70 family sugar kinase